MPKAIAFLIVTSVSLIFAPVEATTYVFGPGNLHAKLDELTREDGSLPPNTEVRLRPGKYVFHPEADRGKVRPCL